MTRMCKIDGYEHIEIIDSIWFSPFPKYSGGNLPIDLCIGIVKVRDTITGDLYCRIGYGGSISQEADEDNIVAGGRKIYDDFFVK